MFDTQLMTGVYMNVLGQDASQFDESDQHPGGGLLLDLDQLITELLSVNGINSCILCLQTQVRLGSVVHREEPLPRPNDSQGVVVRGYASTGRHWSCWSCWSC